jgi:Family of unknown function (DUF6328)
MERGVAVGPGWVRRGEAETIDDRERGSTAGESTQERVNRELIELLNELRVALPGVQVLFAFLLTVPFTDRFSELSDPQRVVFFLTFAANVTATVLLIAPTSYHRLRFREGDKEHMLQTANAFAIAGIVLLALAMGGGTLLLTDLLYGSGFAAVVAALFVAGVSWCWFGLPLTRKGRDR